MTQTPPQPPLPKALALERVRSLKRWVIAGSIATFFAVTGLIASNVNAASSSSSQDSSSQNVQQDNSGSFFDQGGQQSGGTDGSSQSGSGSVTGSGSS